MTSKPARSGRRRLRSLTFTVAVLATTLAVVVAGVVFLGGVWQSRLETTTQVARLRQIASDSWSYTRDQWERRAITLAQLAIQRPDALDALRRADRDGVFAALGTFFNYSKKGAMLHDWDVLDSEGRAYASFTDPKRPFEPRSAVVAGRPIKTFSQIERVSENGIPVLVIPLYGMNMDMIGWFRLRPSPQMLINELERLVKNPIVFKQATGSIVHAGLHAAQLDKLLAKKLKTSSSCVLRIEARTFRCAAITPSPETRLVIGFEVTNLERTRDAATAQFAAGAIFVIIGVVVLGVRMIDREVRPIRRLARSLTDSKDPGDAVIAVPHRGADEIVVLGRTLALWAATIREQMAALAESRDEARRADQAKSGFLANMSHEIRTPLTAILGFADLLDDDPVQTASAIRTIRNNANHLLTIINDILDMSKIEAGKMAVEKISTRPEQIVEEVASLMQPRARGKGVNVLLRYDTSIPEHIESDPTRLRQILLNLVGNAVKFTERGDVTIHASCDRLAQTMQFCVRDTGIGMTPEQRDAIALFDAFNQADGSTTRKFGGTGLGLRISNSLAQMLGGEINVESELGAGSAITVTVSTGDLSDVKMRSPDQALRLAKIDHENRTEKKMSHDEAAPLSGLRILLAEDGPDNQRLIALLLRKAGADVTVVENGRLAFQAVMIAPLDEPFDVVLMDMQMPELDGYGATRKLRKEGLRLPVIALTAHAMDADRQRCLDAGCDDYVTKPIDRGVLLNTCARWGGETVSAETAVH